MERDLRRRGWTILELLIVLALLGTLAGLALPVLSSRSRGWALEAAASQARASIRSCRAEAMREGTIVRLEKRTGDSGAVRLWSRAARAAAAEETAVERGDGNPGAREGTGSPDPDRVRMLFELPRGIGAGLNPPTPATDGTRPTPTSDMAMSDAELVATFLPDGTVVSEGPLFVWAEPTMVLSIRVARWTGGVTIETYAASPPRPEEEEEAGPGGVPDDLSPPGAASTPGGRP